MISIILYIFNIIISMYKSHFKQYQTVIINDAVILSTLNKYDFSKYLVNESAYEYGNIQASFIRYVFLNFKKTYLYNNHDYKFIPLRKSYFYDTKYNMCGYITYGNEYIVQARCLDVYTLNKEITLHLDIKKSKYTFVEYLAKIRQDILESRSYITSCHVNDRPIFYKYCEVKMISGVHQTANNYFPGTIYILVGDIYCNYIYSLANLVHKPTMFVDIKTINIWIERNTDLVRSNIIIVNDFNSLVDNKQFYYTLNLIRYIENSITIIHVENYNEVEGTKVLEFMTGYTMHK
jgi:hypothetical protein